jgi:hypothetical protein
MTIFMLVLGVVTFLVAMIKSVWFDAPEFGPQKTVHMSPFRAGLNKYGVRVALLCLAPILLTAYFRATETTLWPLLIIAALFVVFAGLVLAFGVFLPAKFWNANGLLDLVGESKDSKKEDLPLAFGLVGVLMVLGPLFIFRSLIMVLPGTLVFVIPGVIATVVAVYGLMNHFHKLED